MYTKKELIESLENLPDDKPVRVLLSGYSLDYSETLDMTGVGSANAFKDTASVMADCSTLDDLVNDLTGAANFMRGMSMDPGLPKDRREALLSRATEIDESLTVFDF